MNKTKIFLLSAFLCVGMLLETSCSNDDDSVIYTNTEQSNPTNSQNQQVENNIDNNQENADNNVLDSDQDNEGTKTLYMTLVINTANISKTGISKAVSADDDLDVIAFAINKADALCLVGGCCIDITNTNTVNLELEITGKNEDVNSFESGEIPLFLVSGDKANLSPLILEFGSKATLDLSSPILQTVNLGSPTTHSYSSIEEAKHANTLLMSPPIKYSSEPVYAELKEVEDVAQPAYIEIFMSPLQHNIDVTIDGKIQNYQMSDDGKVCITVADGSSFSTNFTDIVVAKSGEIITINREGLVDLGLSDGTLWADKNVGADTYDGLGEYYNFDAAQTAVSGKLSVPKGGQSDSDFAKLKNGCTWTWTMGYNGGSLAGYIVYKQGGSNKDSEPHIFLPAAGMHRDGEAVSFDTPTPRGYYWSSTKFDVYYGYHLYFNENGVSPDDWYYNSSQDYIKGQFPVRAVWHK